MSISLVVGLGNPGAEYAGTRHNLGWIVVNALARRHGLAWKREAAFDSELARWAHPAGRIVWLAKPLTFVNESGTAAAAIAHFHRIAAADVAAVYDDLTMDAGRLKLTVAGSAGGHNGVASLLQHLGDGFARYRIGIGPKEPPEMDLKDYVLSRFSKDQLTIIEQKLPTYLEGLELLLERGADPAMNRINRRDP
jgi:PTH1 family peptidyl-tRNA hydrolase